MNKKFIDYKKDAHGNLRSLNDISPQEIAAYRRRMAKSQARKEF
jgi:hypothetical protein